MKNDKLYLHDIVVSIVKIQSYTKTGRDDFFASPLIQDAVIRNFEVIGEATKRLSSILRDSHSDIPWKSIAGLRDILIHDYDRVVLQEIWSVVQRDLPVIHQKILDILQVIE